MPFWASKYALLQVSCGSSMVHLRAGPKNRSYFLAFLGEKLRLTSMAMPLFGQASTCWPMEDEGYLGSTHNSLVEAVEACCPLKLIY